MTRKDRADGFTLIEVAIVMLISSIILAAVAQGFHIYLTDKKKQETRENLAMIQNALSEFQNYNGRFPCPADPSLAPGNANYGREARDGAGNCTSFPSATGRDADDTVGLDTVSTGSVPYQTLLKPPAESAIYDTPLRGHHILDGWKNKITYSVTRNLTKKSTYKEEWGAIYVKDENNQSVITPDGGAQAVLVSHGENGRGAYTANGGGGGCGGVSLPAPPVTTPPTVATPVNEIENCNGDAVFLSGLRNLSNHSYNDDFTTFIIIQNSNLWRFGATPDMIYNTNGGNVGFGTDQPVQALHVNGTLETTGDLHAPALCDEDGVECMPVNVFSGGRIACGVAGAATAGTVLRGILNNEEFCTTPVITPAASVTCTNDVEFMSGVKSDGSIVCCLLATPTTCRECTSITCP